MKRLRPKTRSILGHVYSTVSFDSFLIVIHDLWDVIATFENSYNVSFPIVEILPLHDLHQDGGHLFKKLSLLVKQHLQF